jgi:hypothetical protein
MKQDHSLPSLPLRWLWSMLVVLAGLAPVQAQYPSPRLTTVNPPGGKAGTTVEVTLGGADLDEVKTLTFGHPGIKAEYIPPPPPPAKGKPAPPGPPKFKVTIPANVPPGTYDIRATGKWGISNPRIFSVGLLNEVQEKEPNNDVNQAQKVELNTTINGVISSNVEVDFSSFTGKKGQTVVLYCAGSAIDSRLSPYIQIYDPAGREVAAGHHYRENNALVAFTPPADGDYLIRLTAYAYLVGNAEYFYRLTLTTGPWIDAAFPVAVPAGKTTPVTLLGWNLPGGKPAGSEDEPDLQQVTVNVNAPASTSAHPLNYNGPLSARNASVDGFEYRLENGAQTSNPIVLAYARAPLVLDNGTSTPEKPQAITVPAEINGRIEKIGDRDCYSLSAKKGEVYIIEGFADRLGSPLDLYFKIRRVNGMSKQVLGEYDEHPEIPQLVGKFFTYTNDPKTRFVVPADGQYEILVSSRTADSQADPRSIYRVCVRPEQPDFHLVVIGTDELSGAGLTLNQGASQEIQVVCFRHEGFDGEIVLSAEGLPGGVTCPAQVLGPKLKQTTLVVSAAAGAAPWAGPIRIKGTAQINGNTVTREARIGSFVWPASGNNPAYSRLADSVCLAVRDKGPYGLDVDPKELTVPLGGKVSVKITMNRYLPDFKNQVQLRRIAAPGATNGNFINIPNVTIPANKNEVTANFNIPNNAQPGTFNLVWRGQGQYGIIRDPKSKRKQNIQVRFVTPPIKVNVYNEVAEVSVPEKIQGKVNSKVPLVVKLKRLHDYKGSFQVQLIRPGGVPISAGNIQIPNNANEGTLMLNIPGNAKPNTYSNLTVRVTARVGSANMTSEAKFAVTVVK